ncbi:MAG: 2-phosphosulfolactate phosphatase [Bacteroidetes bacterium]|nr:2-phosphosulfolactate phosphatase [Bacteroidota bacterium]
MKNQVEVVLSPLVLPNYTLEEKIVVVIDILRATSTMCAALYNGAEAIIPVVDTQEAQAYSHEHPDYLIAGEREGQKADGFNFGNSPAEYTPSVIAGKTLVLTTTNGTKCINASKAAHMVMVGSFFNLSVLSNFLKSSKRDVVLFCSGWKNRVNIEDTLFAGAMVDLLKETHFAEDDSAELSADLFRSHGDDLTHYLRKASHPRRFERLGNHLDLALCCETDRYPVLMSLVGDRLLKFQP